MTERGHLLLAGALTAYLAFDAGGYFPGPVGIAAAVLAVGLVGRITLVDSPWAGWSVNAAVVAAAGALLASWTLLSTLWSDAPARAVLEFDRVLVYLLVFSVFAMVPRRPGALSLLLRWVLVAIVAAAVAGLATRLLPDVFGTLPGRDFARLAHPLTYWNALGVFCALGAVLALHVACDGESPVAVRVLAPAALPLLVVAGYFTFSRGAAATAALGLLAYAVLAHPRRLPFALAAGLPAVAVALHAAYGADALATERYFAGAGPQEGHHVARVVIAASIGAALIRLALLVLERRVERVRIEPRARRRALAAVVAAGLLCALAGAVAIDAPARYRSFVAGDVVRESTDFRERLGQTGSNGRLDFWRADLDAFAAEPFHGTGAGTFRLEWERRRGAPPTQAVDGHSLLLEVLAELGVVGGLLLAVMLGGVAVAMVRGLRGPDRLSRAALAAAGGALLVHAQIDWDWEMTALFAWLFAAAGVAAARPAGPAAADRQGPARLTRVVAGLLCLLLAVTPALAAASQSALDRSLGAFARGDCAGAVDGALDSLDALRIRPEPYEILGYCNLRGGQTRLAVQAMEAARRRDPGSWRPAYGLAVAQALAGEDPRAAAAAAARLNPLEPLARELARGFRDAPRARWPRVAARASLPTD